MGTCFWNCVGRCSQVHSDDEKGEHFAVGYIRQQCRSSNRFVAMALLCQLEMGRVQMMTGCKLTLSRKARERAKVKNNTREEIARPARPTRALQTSTRARNVAELDSGRKNAGDQVEERMTIPPTEILAKQEETHRQREKQTRGRCRNRTTSAF